MGTKGDKGDKGDQGAKGDTGAAGKDADVAGVVQYARNPDGSFDKNKLDLNASGNGPTTISNLADGVSGNDAVNVNQLNQSANKWVTGNIVDYKAPTALGVNATAIGSGAIAIGNNSVALGVNSTDEGRANVVSMGAPGAERQLTNVAAGTKGTDAVNVNQLNQGLGVLNYQLTRMDSRIDKVERNAYAGVAAAVAMHMPASYVPGKTVMRIGAGVFKGESALSLTFRRTAENNAWSLTGGVGVSRGGTAAALGAEWVFE